MKTFYELLATEPTLTVEINGEITPAGLHGSLTFDSLATVRVDGIEVLPKYQHLAKHGQLTINQPFYCWYHTVSGQGWLLKPQ